MEKTPTIGFISPPAWFDPAPAEFATVVVEKVRTQQAPILLPDFDYSLESVASVQRELDLCARSLAAAGCDLVAQVGSPFAWAMAKSEEQARERRESMEKAAKVPVVMTGLAIVDRLRDLGVRDVAADCTYYDSKWRDAFAAFLDMCGFNVMYAGTMADRGLVDPSSKMEDYGWSMTPELTVRSVTSAAEMAPGARAVIVTGAGTRTLSVLKELEVRVGRPVVAADTVLYWAVARKLGLGCKVRSEE